MAAEASVQGVRLSLTAQRRDDPLAELRLSAEGGGQLRLCEDLLTVLGWSWRPLRRLTTHWRTDLKVARRSPERTRDLESKLARTVAHLAEILSERPAHFHERHGAARWRASLRRGLPLFAVLGMCALTPALHRLAGPNESVLHMIVFQTPPLLLLALFMLRELPSIELPRIPRQLQHPAWVEPAGATAAR